LEDMDTRGRRVVPREDRMSSGSPGGRLVSASAPDNTCQMEWWWSGSKGGYTVMTDQKSGATPFNCVLVCVVFCRSQTTCSSGDGGAGQSASGCDPCLGFGAFSSFLHLFHFAFFIFPTSLQIHLLSPLPIGISLRSENFGRGCGMWSTIFILFLILVWWNLKKLVMII